MRDGVETRAQEPNRIKVRPAPSRPHWRTLPFNRWKSSREPTVFARLRRCCRPDRVAADGQCCHLRQWRLPGGLRRSQWCCWGSQDALHCGRAQGVLSHTEHWILSRAEQRSLRQRRLPLRLRRFKWSSRSPELLIDFGSLRDPPGDNAIGPPAVPAVAH